MTKRRVASGKTKKIVRNLRHSKTKKVTRKIGIKTRKVDSKPSAKKSIKKSTKRIKTLKLSDKKRRSKQGAKSSGVKTPPPNLRNGLLKFEIGPERSDSKLKKESTEQVVYADSRRQTLFILILEIALPILAGMGMVYFLWQVYENVIVTSTAIILLALAIMIIEPLILKESVLHRDRREYTKIVPQPDFEENELRRTEVIKL